jgi:hypothetical protein
MTNIVSVSWGDHLIFGEGDGRLDTPEAVQRRMHCWREELKATTIHWRVPRSMGSSISRRMVRALWKNERSWIGITDRSFQNSHTV